MSYLDTWVVLHKTLLGKNTHFCRSKDDFIGKLETVAVTGGSWCCWMLPFLIWGCCFCWPPLAFLCLSLLIIAGPVVWSMVTNNTDNCVCLIKVPYFQSPAPQAWVKKTFFSVFHQHKGSICSVTWEHLIGSFCATSGIFLLVALFKIIYFCAWIKNLGCRCYVFTLSVSECYFWTCPSLCLSTEQYQRCSTGTFASPAMEHRQAAH